MSKRKRIEDVSEGSRQFYAIQIDPKELLRSSQQIEANFQQLSGILQRIEISLYALNNRVNRIENHLEEEKRKIAERSTSYIS